jgi:hypothetical protein
MVRVIRREIRRRRAEHSASLRHRHDSLIPVP